MKTNTHITIMKGRKYNTIAPSYDHLIYAIPKAFKYSVNDLARGRAKLMKYGKAVPLRLVRIFYEGVEVNDADKLAMFKHLLCHRVLISTVNGWVLTKKGHALVRDNKLETEVPLMLFNVTTA